jgi:hypothetical protein
MKYDIADNATDNYNFEDMALRFKEASEATKALWVWQEAKATHTTEDAGHDAFGDTLGSNSLAAPFQQTRVPSSWSRNASPLRTRTPSRSAKRLPLRATAPLT